jgi:hypothetical protein
MPQERFISGASGLELARDLPVFVIFRVRNTVYSHTGSQADVLSIMGVLVLAQVLGLETHYGGVGTRP